MASQNSYADDCLKSLLRIAEDIPSGVSEERLTSILQVKSSQELLGSLNNIISSACKQPLQRLWDEYQVGVKLTHLKELERNSPPNEAWRPITGKVDINPFIVDSLLKQKMELKKEIELLKKESEAIKPPLKNFHERARCQIEEMDNIEKAYKEKVTKSEGIQ
ncbi:uncharacterized protein isoform X1 [Leptinotarsa decemlineata]|uniref:uncharacterized protein isoform X1 n=1 Tax=Leptinotarsa decemlineata TaxID=7539 RepID=UPI003D30574B